jgi:hypothetical protein
MAKMFSSPFGFAGRSWSRSRRAAERLRAAAVGGPRGGRDLPVYEIEPLEARLVLSAVVGLQNMDGLPGPERLIFNRIQIQPPGMQKDGTGMLYQPPNNVVHDQATLRISNNGDQPLVLSSPGISGPWQVVGTFPSSIDPGSSADVTLKFVAQSAPKLPYNETNGTTNGSRAGAWVGSLTFNTNDPNLPQVNEQLAGWWQQDNENNEEPSLQSMVNLIANYPTAINSTHVNILDEPGGQPKYYGEEVVSPYWQAADPSKNIGVRTLASFHTGQPRGRAILRPGDGRPARAVHDRGERGAELPPARRGQDHPGGGELQQHGDGRLPDR